MTKQRWLPTHLIHVEAVLGGGVLTFSAQKHVLAGYENHSDTRRSYEEKQRGDRRVFGHFYMFVASLQGAWPKLTVHGFALSSCLSYLNVQPNLLCSI